MAYVDTNKETITVDASPVGIRIIHAQEGLGSNDCRVVAYASRALSPVEKRYSQTEKEVLRIVWAVEDFHLFLYGKFFKLITDCKLLEMIYGSCKSKPSASIERWVLRLHRYHFTVKFKSGVDNSADYLSRHPLQRAFPNKRRIRSPTSI